jgi:hypothetical protein
MEQPWQWERYSAKQQVNVIRYASDAIATIAFSRAIRPGKHAVDPASVPWIVGCRPLVLNTR